MMHIKEPLLLFGTSSRCYGDSAFSLSLSEWSSTLIGIMYKINYILIVRSKCSCCYYI